MNRDVIFFETESGEISVKDFLENLDFAVIKRILWTLQIIKESDIVPSIYFKKLKDTDEIWEVRIRFASNIYRIFSFWDKRNLIVLTHGIMKKSQKNPQFLWTRI